MGSRSALLFATLIGAAVLAAGCKEAPVVGTAGPVSPSPTATPAGSGPPTDATTPPADPTTPPATTAPPSRTPECKQATGLTVEPGTTDAAAGHRRLVLVFTNTGDTTCVLTGYPGVDALDAGGHSVAHAQRTPSGYMGGIPAGTKAATVTLEPGDAASAIVEALAFGVDGPCKAYAGLLVTAPDDTRSSRVDWAHTDACTALQVHPVVAGADG